MANWLQDIELDVSSIKAAWCQQSEAINKAYAEAALVFADHVLHDCLDGKPELLRKVEFECAVTTRNRMLGAAATALLAKVDKSVTSLECYEQYIDGLITSDECCNWIATH